MSDKQAIMNYLTKLGIAYDAEFIPMKQEKEQHPQLHWRITLTRHPHTMVTNYSQGMAHVKGYKQYDKSPYDTRLNHEACRKTCETGKLFKKAEHFTWSTNQMQPKPDLVDVLYCLVSDADVINSIGFEDWAENLGYDTDSRKAEDIYRACLKQTRELLPIINGPKGLETLQELYQDY